MKMNRTDVYQAARDVLPEFVALHVLSYWRRDWCGARLYIPQCKFEEYVRRAHPLSATCRWLRGTEDALRYARGVGSVGPQMNCLINHIGGQFICF